MILYNTTDSILVSTAPIYTGISIQEYLYLKKSYYA